MKVAIVGLGNCAWSLMQSIEMARRGGLTFTSLVSPTTSEEIGELDVVLGFDVHEAKVGRDLSVAAATNPNCTSTYIDLPFYGSAVVAGPLCDGLDGALREVIEPASASLSASRKDVVDALRRHEVEAVVLYLPVGSQQAAELYTLAALEAGCSVVNCTPALLANSEHLAKAFQNAGQVLLGDDMRSHVGSTTVHQALLQLFKDRGLKIKSTYQLNIGGNTDFLNMRDKARSQAKRATKAAALAAFLDVDERVVGIGPSDYVPALKDRKVGYINVVAEGFLGMEITMEMKLSVEDSPNAAPIGLDALLALKKRKHGESLDMSDVCRQLFKHPQTQIA